MIKYVKGDLFLTDCNSICHGVSCAGVMGVGVAKRMKERYPANFKYYHNQYKFKKLKPGEVYIFAGYPRKIINLTTQSQYGRKRIKYATLENIKSCFLKLKLLLPEYNKVIVKKGSGPIQSIALPRIGSGYGGLNWKDVKNLIDTHLSDTVPIVVFEDFKYGMKAEEENEFLSKELN